MHRLALVQSIRKWFSVQEAPEVDSVIEQTPILQLVSDLIAPTRHQQSRQDQEAEEVCYYMQLEALWILTNLAVTEDADNMRRILASSLCNPSALAQMTTEDLIDDLKFNES